MSPLIRCLRDSKSLWRVWLVPTIAAGVAVPLHLALPLIHRELVDGALLPGRLDRLVQVLGLYALVWLLMSLLGVLGGASQAQLNERLSLHLRRRLFAHCEALSVPFWHREHSGRTMTLFSSDVPTVTGFLGAGLVSVFAQITTLVFAAVVMFQLNAILALVVVSIPPLIGGLAWIVTRPLRAASRQVQEKTAELNERLHESLGGLREIAAFGQEQSQGARLAATLQDLLRLRLRLAFMGAGIGAGQSLFSLAVMLSLFSVGGYLTITGRTTIGTLLAMMQLLGQVYQPAMSLVGTVVGVQSVLASADRVYAMLDRQPLVREREAARDLRQAVGEVRFDDVTFAYTAGQPTLQDVSFTARPGEVTALVGPSGAGKSTLVGLIARFYDPDTGRITLDGTDLRDLTLAGVRRHIAMVFQDPYLFSASIRENIAFGREDATELEIVAAAHAACAWEFVERLPKGLDTPVGQRAIQLSEGQKQRLAVARALLRNPRILILDEPTSALDARSEHFLQAGLDNLMRGRTTFVIAHRLATIRRADQILVLDQGCIVQRGSHPDLLSVPGLYRDLCELQFAGTESAPPAAPAIPAASERPLALV